MSDWSGRRLKDLISYTRENDPNPTLRPTMTSSLSNGAIKSSGACTSFLPQKSSLELRLPCLSFFDGVPQFFLVWLLIFSFLSMLLVISNTQSVKFMTLGKSLIIAKILCVQCYLRPKYPSRIRHIMEGLDAMLQGLAAEQLPIKICQGKESLSSLFWRSVKVFLSLSHFIFELSLILHQQVRLYFNMNKM